MFDYEHELYRTDATWLRATSGARNPNLNIGYKRMRGSYIALQWLEFSKKSRPSKYLSLGTLRTNEMKGRNLTT